MTGCRFFLQSLVIFSILFFSLGGTVVAEEDDNTLESIKSYYINGEFTRAYYLISQFLIEHPGNISALNLKGLLLLANGSFVRAEESFLEAYNVSPNDPRIQYNVGLAAFNHGDFQKAEQFFNLSLTNNFYSPDLFFYYGLVKYGLSEYSEAINLLSKATELRPDDPATWFNLGIAFEKVRKYNNAVLAYDKALSIDPLYAKPYYFKGRIYSSLGNESLAVSSFKNYTNLEPHDDLGWFWYSKSLKKTNRINESMDALYTAITLNPNNTEYKTYYSIYSGTYNDTPMESVFRPLTSQNVFVFFGILVILSIIAVMRKGKNKS